MPYALSWGYAGICAAGNDRMVRFWDSEAGQNHESSAESISNVGGEGREGQTFDYSTDSRIKDVHGLFQGPGSG